MPAVSLVEIIKKITPVTELHGIEFQKDKLVLAESNPLVYWEDIPDAPRSHIYYQDIINIDNEDIYLFILLRSGYYHRLSKWEIERIYNHVYWDRTKEDNKLIRWWYKL